MDFSFFMNLANNFWYLGVFLIGFLSSFLIFLPTPAFLVIFFLAGPPFFFDPLFLGIAAGLGSAVGELVGYILGYGGQELFLKKYEKQLGKIEKQFQKYGAPLIIFIFSVGPLPFDIVGIFCGVIEYPIKKFFIPLLIGKLIKYWAIAYAGFYGISWISQFFGI